MRTCYVSVVDDDQRTELLTRVRKVTDLEAQLQAARDDRDQYYYDLVESKAAGASEIARTIGTNRVVVQRVIDNLRRAARMNATRTGKPDNAG